MMTSRWRLITCLARAAAAALLAVGLSPQSGPAPLQAQVADGQGKRVDARVVPDPDDEERPSPRQLEALARFSPPARRSRAGSPTRTAASPTSSTSSGTRA